ncbi:MAG: hypothetical protein J07HB67_01764, partial [halophilic archaeon J07HB67]
MTDADDADTGGRTLTRRRLLAVGGSVITAGGTGALYVLSELQSSDGDYTAPTSFPAVSTRNAFADDGTPQFDGDHPTPRVEGQLPATPTVLFVHGFQTDHAAARDQAHTAAVGFDETARPLPTVVYSWDANREWGVAKSVADGNGPALAAWLADADGPVHVVAHSLGARVTCEALRVLADAESSGSVASVSLLGGAVPRASLASDGRYGPAVAVTDAPVANYHSRNDRVLDWVYRLSDGTRAVGHDGLSNDATPPDGYTDVDVSPTVPDHRSYYEPGEGCLPTVVDRLPLRRRRPHRGNRTQSVTSATTGSTSSRPSARIASVAASLSASAYTRTFGSVPLGRTRSHAPSSNNSLNPSTVTMSSTARPATDAGIRSANVSMTGSLPVSGQSTLTLSATTRPYSDSIRSSRSSYDSTASIAAANNATVTPSFSRTWPRTENPPDSSP